MTVWPLPIPDWFWSWAEWRLGRGSFKGHANDPAYRPKSAPAKIPAWAWARLALFVTKPPTYPVPVTKRQHALANLRSKLGVTENPPYSNQCWATIWYGMIGPWCAMSGSWAYAKAGSLSFIAGKYYAYVPYIVADARALRNGLSVVLAKNVIPGDGVCYDWDGGVADHFGLFEKWVEYGKTFYAIEGNTSLTDQSNGGEVMRRLRKVEDVECFVRVRE